MSEQIISKTCRTCKQTKSISEFYKDRIRKDGHQIKCKTCKKEYNTNERGKAAYKRYQQTDKFKAIQKRYKESDKGKITYKRYQQTEKYKVMRQKVCIRYSVRHPKHIQAITAVNKAITIGRLPRPGTLLCHCGTQAEHYHHHKGYEPEHWLDVVPVCTKCHGKTRLAS